MTPRLHLVLLPHLLLQFLDVLLRQFRPVELEGQLVQLAGELERHLIVLVVHRRAGVGADVEVLVPLQDQRQRALHLLVGDLLAVHLEQARAAAADASHSDTHSTHFCTKLNRSTGPSFCASACLRQPSRLSRRNSTFWSRPKPILPETCGVVPSAEVLPASADGPSPAARAAS